MFAAHSIRMRRTGSCFRYASGSMGFGQAERRVTWRRPVRHPVSAALTDSGSKPNEPARLKNSGASVTPSTDLKPTPNRPIWVVPRLGDKWENISDFTPVGSIGFPSSAQYR